MADLTGKYANRLEDNPGDFRRKLISASSAPVGTERDALLMRQAELKASLVASPGPETNDRIYLLIAGSPAFGMTERETDAKVMLYADALKSEPTWAIEKARQALARPGWKSDWNGSGCPSSAQVVAECRAITQPIEAELYRIGQILGAVIVDNTTTQDQRDDALARWALLKADIGGGQFIHERTAAEVAKERAELQRANAVVRAREAAQADRAAANAHLSDLEARRAKREGESQQRENVA
jgi:hypothetical protein